MNGTKLTPGDNRGSRRLGNAHEGFDGVCSLEDEGPVPPSNVTALMLDWEVLHSMASIGGGRGGRVPPLFSLRGQHRKCPHTF